MKDLKDIILESLDQEDSKEVDIKTIFTRCFSKIGLGFRNTFKMKTIEKILNLEEGSSTIAATGQGYNRIIIVLRKNGEEIAPKFIIRKNETRYIGTLNENIFKTKPLNAESVVNDIIATIQCGLAHDFKDWKFTKTL